MRRINSWAAAAANAIFEACSFQDITGQRINKVIKLLDSIDERVGKLNELFGTSSANVTEAVALQKLLEGLGLRVWRDKTELEGGDPYIVDINTAAERNDISEARYPINVGAGAARYRTVL